MHTNFFLEGDQENLDFFNSKKKKDDSKIEILK